MVYDLHVHSNISDGIYSREDIIKKSEELEIKYLSFTEHNRFQEFVNNSSSIEMIRGIEFDVRDGLSFHLLSYFPKFNDEIQQQIETYQQRASDNSGILADNIKRIFSIDISLEKLQQFFGKKVISKRDIINWLLHYGYAGSVEEAANKYTNKNAKSYAPKVSLDFEKVNGIIKASGGYTFVAHPTYIGLDKDELEKFILKLRDKGLDGIEVINTSKMSEKETEYFKNLAKRYNMMMSGGSDFHKTGLGVMGDESTELIRKLTK